MSHDLHPELNTVWNALWRLEDIDLELTEHQWNDICEAMARLQESLTTPHKEV